MRPLYTTDIDNDSNNMSTSTFSGNDVKFKDFIFCWWPVISNKQHSLSLLENTVSIFFASKLS